MKHKLIVTLIASALELLGAAAASQQAQAACTASPGVNANGATPVSTGPLSPVNGFPEYITDSNGVSVQRCLDANFCFFDPIVVTDPFSIQIGSGGEAFYWGATATLSNAAGQRFATVEAAAETAFLQAGPDGVPVDGSQFPFLRARFVIGVPQAGIYKVVHPYGVDYFNVAVATGARDIFSTIDAGFAPSSTVNGTVGPFLRWTNGAPGGFLGDGGPAGASQTVTGSPCGSNVSVQPSHLLLRR
jgi:hypothetical protein